MEKNDRVLAMEWWNKHYLSLKEYYCLKYYSERKWQSLTGREIEYIWKMEVENISISNVNEIDLLEKIKSILIDIEKMDSNGKWYGFMHDEKNSSFITKLWNYCR